MSTELPTVAEFKLTTAKKHLMRWRDQLGLQDWDIRISEAPADDGYQANVDYRSMEKVAIIRLDPELPLESIEPSIIHELLHRVLDPYTDLAKHSVVQLAEPARTIMLDLLEEREEQVIETIMRSHGMPRFNPYSDLLPNWAPFSAQ